MFKIPKSTDFWMASRTESSIYPLVTRLVAKETLEKMGAKKVGEDEAQGAGSPGVQ